MTLPLRWSCSPPAASMCFPIRPISTPITAFSALTFRIWARTNAHRPSGHAGRHLERVIKNRKEGKFTHVYIDEIYLFLASGSMNGSTGINNYSSHFFTSAGNDLESITPP